MYNLKYVIKGTIILLVKQILFLWNRKYSIDKKSITTKSIYN